MQAHKSKFVPGCDHERSVDTVKIKPVNVPVERPADRCWPCGRETSCRVAAPFPARGFRDLGDAGGKGKPKSGRDVNAESARTATIPAATS